MKAVIWTKYGSPEGLVVKEVAKPVPNDNQVLVKVQCASVNSWDWELMRGTPFVNRIMFGLLKPKINILGADISGVVESIGKKARHFKVGDEVFGDLSNFGGIKKRGWGGFAQYVCANENSLTAKPKGITFEEAASLPQASVMALQGLRSIGHIEKGQKVLINGAGGGVGSFALQLAKSFGAQVTAVDSGEKFEVMRSIGADRVLDYTQVDFIKEDCHYDLVLDTALRHSVFECMSVLNPNGTYVIVGGSNRQISQVIFFGWLMTLVGTKKVCLLGLKQNKDLAYIGELVAEGKVRPAIDRVCKLDEVPEALKYFEEGHVKGKLVVTMEHENK